MSINILVGLCHLNELDFVRFRTNMYLENPIESPPYQWKKAAHILPDCIFADLSVNMAPVGLNVKREQVDLGQQNERFSKVTAKSCTINSIWDGVFWTSVMSPTTPPPPPPPPPIITFLLFLWWSSNLAQVSSWMYSTQILLNGNKKFVTSPLLRKYDAITIF